jgi:hypothetical protein
MQEIQINAQTIVILIIALVLVIKIDFNEVLNSFFDNRISLNRTIVLALIVLGMYGVYIGYKEAYLSIISGLLAMTQSQTKDGKNGGR